MLASIHMPDTEIFLPVTAKSRPDWEYMQKYIAALERERISELEQYLAAAGLNDYPLTDKDIKTRSRALVPGVTKLGIGRK